MRRRRHRHLRLSRHQQKLIALRALRAHIHGPLHHLHRRGLRPRTPQRQQRKIHLRVRSQPHRAVVLKLHLGVPIAGLQLLAFDDRHILHRLLEAQHPSCDPVPASPSHRSAAQSSHASRPASRRYPLPCRRRRRSTGSAAVVAPCLLRRRQHRSSSPTPPPSLSFGKSFSSLPPGLRKAPPKSPPEISRTGKVYAPPESPEYARQRFLPPIFDQEPDLRRTTSPSSAGTFAEE